MKKFISLLVLVTVILSLGIVTVYSDPMEPLVIPVMSEDDATAQGLYELGILKGTGNGLELERNITRAEAVALIFRVHYENIGAIGMPSPEFDDLDNHWAYKEVTAAKKMGIVEGVGDRKFEPDRIVTGREFAKMLMSTLGYKNVTIENVYDMALDAELLTNNYAKIVVETNATLLRSDAARILWGVFLAETPEGQLYKDKLVEAGKFAEEDYIGTLVVGCGTPAAPAESFTDKINAQMPDDKNYMFSPLSIQLAFAMAANGASGETQAEMLKALGISDLDEYNEKTMALISEYHNAGALRLDVANAIWLNKDNADFNFNKEYTDLLDKFYEAEANVSDNEKIVGEVNGWVNDKTNGKIPTIIDNPDFASILLNAVYFKGAWESEFYKGATAPDIFTDKNGKENSIDFMNQTDYFDYYNRDGLEIIELPYKNVVYNEETQKNEFYDFDISMYLVRGDYNEGKLGYIVADKMTRERVKLSMPKFKFEYETGLNDIMKNLGIEVAFDANRADFTKMVDHGNMFIADSIHKTYIGVDEEGTEAAAVTAIMMEATSAKPAEPIVVKYDTPFTFVIRDNKNGVTLFIGEYNFAK